MLTDPKKYAATIVKFTENDKALATALFMKEVCAGNFPGVKADGTYALQVINAIWDYEG